MLQTGDSQRLQQVSKLYSVKAFQVHKKLLKILFIQK